MAPTLTSACAKPVLHVECCTKVVETAPKMVRKVEAALISVDGALPQIAGRRGD